MHNLQVCKLISVAPGSKDELLVFSLQPKLPRICATIGNLTWINAILPGKTKEQMKTMVPAGSQETDALTRDGQLALSALLAARGVSTHVCITIDDCSSKPNARRRERRAKHARVRVEPLWTWAEPASRLSKVTTVTDWQPASEPACKTVGWCQLASSTSLASIGDAELKKKKSTVSFHSPNSERRCFSRVRTSFFGSKTFCVDFLTSPWPLRVNIPLSNTTVEADHLCCYRKPRLQCDCHFPHHHSMLAR